jgi:hypothetical protein
VSLDTFETVGHSFDAPMLGRAFEDSVIHDVQVRCRGCDAVWTISYEKNMSCALRGHSFDVITKSATGEPVQVVCSVCGGFWRIDQQKDAS